MSPSIWLSFRRICAQADAGQTLHRECRYTAKPVAETGPIVKIGDLISYGRRVMTGVYELQRLGRSPECISMPLDRVVHILNTLTVVRREIQQRVLTAPIPSEKDVMRRLATECRDLEKFDLRAGGPIKNLYARKTTRTTVTNAINAVPENYREHFRARLNYWRERREGQ